MALGKNACEDRNKCCNRLRFFVISGGDYMPVSKANQRAVAKYMKANYDDIKVRTPKGKRKLIHEHAKRHGESVNGFINRAIKETMERDGAIINDVLTDEEKEIIADGRTKYAEGGFIPLEKI